MASGENWDPDKILQLYLHDYMVKRRMNKAAAIFKEEANVGDNPIVIDSPEGFLYEWWSIFYEIYASRNQETRAEAPAKNNQMIGNERQNVHPIVSQSVMNHQRSPQFQIASNFHNMYGKQAACLLPPKFYEEEHLRHLARDTNPNLRLIDVNKLKISAGTSSSNLQQEIHKQALQQVVRGNINGISLGRTVPRDSMDGVRKIIPLLTGPHGIEINRGLNPVLLNGWPINNQVLSSLFQGPNHQHQFQVMNPQSQKSLFTDVPACVPGARTSILLPSSTNHNSLLLKTPKSEPSDKNGQVMAHVVQTAEHQYQFDRLQQHQFLEIENSIKRKATISPRDGQSTLDGANAAEDRPVGENVESYLSNDNENADNMTVPFSNLKRRSAAFSVHGSKGFAFEEVSCLHSSKGKVLCCHFSSNGKLLASAGHEKKVTIWNMETFDFVTTSEDHSLLITDVRFRPSSTVFATSSFDRTVNIWDSARPNKPLFKLTGHAEQVMSLDFHPRKLDLLCSCDSSDVIRLWNVNQCVCTHVSKAATKQVRFQPCFGKLLATASGNCINVIDIETAILQFILKGHVKDVLSICWDLSGKYIASVSEDSIRLWSAVSGGKCIHELHSNGNRFQSCTFHPGYSDLLIIGGYQSLELWNPTDGSKTLSIPAHKGLITGLSDSQETEMVASASHDQCVKIWK